MLRSNKKKQRDERQGDPAGSPQKGSDILTFVAPGVRIEGKVITSAPLRIDGYVDGEIRAEGEVTVGESGRVAGPVFAGKIVVAGIVDGSVVAERELRILPSGRLTGDVRTPNLIVDEGAVFKGSCDMEREGVGVSKGTAQKAKPTRGAESSEATKPAAAAKSAQAAQRDQTAPAGQSAKAAESDRSDSPTNVTDISDGSKGASRAS